MTPIYVFFNSISVILGRWADDNEMCNGTSFTVEKISPRARIELSGNAISVGQSLTH